MAAATGMALDESPAERSFFVVAADVPTAEEGYAILVRELAARLARYGATRLYSVGKQPAADAIWASPAPA